MRLGNLEGLMLLVNSSAASTVDDSKKAVVRIDWRKRAPPCVVAKVGKQRLMSGGLTGQIIEK